MKSNDKLYYQERQGAHITPKGLKNMDIINRYIDHNLINEYADKNSKHGYLLDVMSLTNHEKSNFLDILFKEDSILRHAALERMQELIDERALAVELQDKYKAGFKRILNDVSGAVTWVRDIKTKYDCKSIPMRDWDWIAYRDGDDPEDQITGFGATEKDAIDALIQIEGN
jgi:hypothetical protein